MRHSTFRGAAVLGALLSCACGSPRPSPVEAPVASASASPHKISPGSTRVGSQKLVDRRHKTALAADNLDQVSRSAAPPKTSTEIYKSVAPATVIVRTPGGFGSGVVVDDGWILTNEHVIANGKGDDFRYRATVLYGSLSADTGAMGRQEQEYEAEVYKADKLRDLALLRVTGGPKGVVPVKIAPTKPLPGHPVIAIGHAGAGMLWALKNGQISSLGKLSETLAALAHFKNDENGKKAEQAFQKSIEAENLGLVIQSTCNILPGDSGGPLVNDRGELVGLNVFSRRDSRTGGMVSFHVHRDELASFLKNRPTAAPPLVPDPWEEGGGDLSFDDVDLDGFVDVLVMKGRRPCSFCPPDSRTIFVDVDQDSYSGRSLPDMNDVYAKRDFDAEAAHLQIGPDAFVWLDKDNDGAFDVLLFDKGTRGIITTGYTIGTEGLLTEDTSLASLRPFPLDLIDVSLRAKMARITGAAFPKRYASGSTVSSGALPVPVGNHGKASPVDLDDDNKNDGVVIDTPFSNRMLIDADHNFAKNFAAPFAHTESTRKKMDAEIVVVSQGPQMWVFYDTDDDRRFDLVLHTPQSRQYVAVEAFRLAADGTKTLAPEHVGRKLLRPELLVANQRAAVRALVGHGLLKIMSADDDGLGSFPDPAHDHRVSGMKLLEVKGAPKQVVAIDGGGSDGYLVDLDRDSGLFGPADKIDIEGRVKRGRFDAEFAYFERNGVAYAFYDTDRTKGWDRIRISLSPQSNKVAVAFRIRKGVAELEPKAVGQPLVDPKLFPSKASTMRAIATDLFASGMIAPK